MFTLLSDDLAVRAHAVTIRVSPRRSFQESVLSAQVPSSCSRQTDHRTHHGGDYLRCRFGWYGGWWRAIFTRQFLQPGLILLCLLLLGRAEERIGLKAAVHIYEVAGQNADRDHDYEINRLLECSPRHRRQLAVAATPQHVRVQFRVIRARRKDQEKFLSRSAVSRSVFESATFLGPVDHRMNRPAADCSLCQGQCLRK